LTDANAEITLSTRYTSWGDTLELNGTGNFTFGYSGGLMDEATGLIYVGNGQYYDPATGRFLTRDANPNSPNPYVPFDPTGLLFAPLGLMVVFYGGRKSKKSAPCMLMLMMLVVLPLTVGLACDTGTPAATTPIATATQPPGGTQVAGSATVAPTATSTPEAPAVITIPDCPTAPPTAIDEEMAQYGVYFTGVVQGWNTLFKNGTAIDATQESAREAVKEAVIEVAKKFAGIIGGSPQDAFKRVYGYINFEWCNGCVSDAFGENTDDHTIKFDGMYMWEHYKRVRNVVHELGHMFDRKVCASRELDGECDIVGDEIRMHSSARTDLQKVWNNEEWRCQGDKSCLSRSTPTGPRPGIFWGFAGDLHEWQYGQTDGEGEVWADMFLGWVYNKWGNDEFGGRKQEYMNDVMKTYLRSF